MPQLKGKEYREVYDLLLDYLSPPGLDRVLQHNDLPSLVEIGGQGDFRSTVFHTVEELSKRYQIVELLEGVLAELDGSCPPLEAWLEVHRQELLRRRDHPTTREKVSHSVQSHKWLWGAGIMSLIVLAILAAGAMLPERNIPPDVPDDSTITLQEIRLIESDFVPDITGTNREVDTLRLDADFVNKGSQTAVLASARLHIDKVVKVKRWHGIGVYPPGPPPEYLIQIPLDNPAPYSLEVKIDKELAPNGADSPETFKFTLMGLGDMSYNAIICARMEFLLETSAETITSKPVVFVLGSMFPRWKDMKHLTADNILESDNEEISPFEAYQAQQFNYEALPQLESLTGFKSTNRFREIVATIRESVDPQELETALQEYQHLRRAFFIEAYSSLIHPSLISQVFSELKASLPQLPASSEERLMSEYDEYKSAKLAWLENKVLPNLRSMAPVDGVSEQLFLLPESIRLSDDDKIPMEKSDAQHEWEFIIGKLRGDELEQVVVKTFVEETIMPMLRRFHVNQPIAIQDPNQAKRFVQRAAFDELGLFGNSVTCLNQALEIAGANFPWVEQARGAVIQDFDQLINARIDWLNRALYQLDSSESMVSIPVPDMIKVDLEGMDDLNQIDVYPDDRMSLKRELELLTATAQSGSIGRASTPGRPGNDATTPFIKVIVRFAAQNVRKQYNQSMLKFPN